jgi:hypothetical protein
MSVLGYFLSGSKLKKAKKLTAAARKEEADKADLLFQEAYKNYAAVSESYSGYPDTLYNWGFALLHQAQTKSGDDAVKIFEESIIKFSFCSTIAPNHLGAAVDGGVALLGLAKAKAVNLDNEIYIKARASFEKAEEIQQASASYNLACMYALQSDGDACLEALEKARDYGLVPAEEDIIKDDDLENIKQLAWFDEFIASLTEEEEATQEENSDEKKAEEETSS